MKKLLLLAIVVLGISAVSFGQEKSATAKSSATIITHIDIKKTNDLDFGGIVSSATGGDVTILPEDGAKPTASGDIVIPKTNFGTPMPAKFNVKGEKGSTYSINLRKTDIVLTNKVNAEATMALKLTTSSSTGKLDDVNGTQDIYVGGVLTLIGGQAAGLYENAGELEVIVNYN